MKQKLLPAFIFILFIASCRKTDVPATVDNPASKYPADVATKWIQLQLELIRTTPGFTPPVASRSLAYTGLALYQAVQPGIPGNKNIDEILHTDMGLPYYSVSDNDWVICANAACYNMIKKLFSNVAASDAQKIEDLYNNILNERNASGNMQSARSIQYGADVAKVIFEWSQADGADNAQLKNFPASYTLPVGTGLWTPTSSQLIPLQPFWGNNRVFCTDNRAQNCLPTDPISFSSNNASAFYQEAMVVYNTSLALTQTQKDIALYWADGGGTYTPPGHLTSIAAIIAKQKNYTLAQAAELFAKTGMACADAFIMCWKAKYQHNLMRPVTYIKNYIQPSWQSFIATPPFPTYGSGHSTVSGAVSEVLKSYFGNTISFTDNTNQPFGLGTKNISNLEDMANEAAVSRLYGGIHFPMDNNNALTAGKNIGRNIVAMNFKR
jgi:hypothetical protein